MELVNQQKLRWEYADLSAVKPCESQNGLPPCVRVFYFTQPLPGIDCQKQFPVVVNSNDVW